jgi:hypothetical protein
MIVRELYNEWKSGKRKLVKEEVKMQKPYNYPAFKERVLWIEMGEGLVGRVVEINDGDGSEYTRQKMGVDDIMYEHDKVMKIKYNDEKRQN